MQCLLWDNDLIYSLLCTGKSASDENLRFRFHQTNNRNSWNYTKDTELTLNLLFTNYLFNSFDEFAKCSTMIFQRWFQLNHYSAFNPRNIIKVHSPPQYLLCCLRFQATTPFQLNIMQSRNNVSSLLATISTVIVLKACNRIS